MIYLDNAATTDYKPPQVINAVNDCLTKYPYNPNRSGRQSVQLQQALTATRQKISLLVNCDQSRVIFTHGCTDALNTAILGTARRGHIVISCAEHNSVARPVMRLKERGFADVSVIEPDTNGNFSVESLSKVVRKDTYLFCLTHASNVTGQRHDIAPLGRFCRQNGIVFLVDCAQSMGYFCPDMQNDCVDIVAFGAHKGLHAMQGAGALAFGNVRIRPVCFGGTGTDSHLLTQPEGLPEALESGTLPTPAIMAMSAGIDWWLNNAKQNEQNVRRAQELILEGLKRIDGVKIYSQPNQSGIVSFNVKNLDSNFVADVLAERFDVAVRGGLQCAPLMHKHLGTLNSGIVRASTSCVTTQKDCFALLDGVEYLAKRFE